MNKKIGPPMEEPSPEILARVRTEWVDPITDAPAGTQYGLYPTPARGADTQGSYLIYLPPGYERDHTRRFPVIYWLHGGFGNARQGEWAVRNYAAAMQAGQMPETIIVLVQALPVGWYVDSKDGKMPIEQVLIHNLLPYIDSTYRTAAKKEGRGIEGHSMGGYGALHLGLKYPDLFGAIFSVAPSILRDMTQEPEFRTYDTFAGDQAYYEEVGPWNLARLNAARLAREQTALKLIIGKEDGHLVTTLDEFHIWLKDLGIDHAYVLIAGAGHDYAETLLGDGANVFHFWANAFRDVQK